MNKQEIIQMAREAGFGSYDHDPRASAMLRTLLQRFATLAYERGVRDEREACAQLCEQADEECHEYFGSHCAAAIRARNNKENQQ